MEINYTEALNIFELSSLEGLNENQLKKQYHKLAPKYHPDRGGNVEDFIKLREAYTLLKKALVDPKYRSDNFQNQQNSNGFQNNYNSQAGVNYEILYKQALEQLNKYQENYQRMTQIIKSYENKFNDIIRFYNHNKNLFNQNILNYNFGQNKLKEELNQKLKSLEKRYKGNFLQFVFGREKMSKYQYVQESNSLISSYNQQIRLLEQQFLTGVLNSYKKNFDDLVELLD